MPIATFKVIAFFAIFLTGIGGGLLSRRLSNSKNSEVLFSMGNAFAGGVFLGAGIIHMLPDAREGFAALLGDVDYPWFALACSSGFLFILFLEKICFPGRHAVAETPGADASGRLLYPYVLMLVLSIHSIITGIALGTESGMAQAAIILIAVVAHKGTAAFALSVSMLRAGVARRRFFSLLVCFSMATPVGILLGAGAMLFMSGTAEKAFEAIFDALAAGTFLYVAIVDIMQEEFAAMRNLWLKFVLVLLGLGLMAVVAIWT